MTEVFDLVPITQNLVASAAWAVGSVIARAARGGGVPTQPLGIFTAVGLDTYAVAAGVSQDLERDGLPASLQRQDLGRLLEHPDLHGLLHELLTSRLLEQPEAQVVPLHDAFVDVVRLELPDLGDGGPAFAYRLFDALDSACWKIVKSLDESDEATRAQVQELAAASALVATLKTIERHVAALRARSPEQREAFASYATDYAGQVLARHGELVLPDLEVERTVPVDDLYVEARLVHDGPPIDSVELLPSVVRRAVVLGKPGGGKSTLAQVLTYRLARDGGPTPFLVVLRDYGPDFDDGRSIVQHIERTANVRYQIPPPGGWVESVLLAGSAVVTFDGLDELLDPARRREIRNAVEAFCSRFPMVRVVVTSRLVGYEQAPLGRDFSSLELGDLHPHGVEQYVEAWFRHALVGLSDQARAERVYNFMRESELVEELRVSPLLLSLMCVLYKGSNYIPESRLGLYEECTRLLFKKWDRSRGIHVNLEIGHDIDAALMHLAYWMLVEQHAEEGVAEQAFVRQCGEYLVPARFEDMDDALRVAEEFIRFCRGRAWVLADAGSTEDGTPLYTFTHRTFLEYYAAHHIARIYGSPEDIASALAPRLQNGEWDVVGQLALQIANKNNQLGADRFLATLIETAAPSDDAREAALDFAARALQFCVPSPTLVRRVASEAYQFNVIESHPRREGEFGRGGPLGHAMGAVEACWGTVASQLRTDIAATLANGTTGEEAVRALGVVVFSRLLAAPSELRQKELYERWNEWTATCVGADAPLRDVALATVDTSAAVGALEVGLLSLDEFLARHPMVSLWSGPLHWQLGVNRVETMPFLAGWWLGQYFELVFLPDMPLKLTTQLPGAVAQAELPWLLPAADESLSRHARDGDSRLGRLPEDAYASAVLLLCMLDEAGVRSVEDALVIKHPVIDVFRALRTTRSTHSRGEHAEPSDWTVTAETLSRMPAAAADLLLRWALAELDFWHFEAPVEQSEPADLGAEPNEQAE